LDAGWFSNAERAASVHATGKIPKWLIFSAWSAENIRFQKPGGILWIAGHFVKLGKKLLWRL
jgi:DNA modification methylase